MVDYFKSGSNVDFKSSANPSTCNSVSNYITVNGIPLKKLDFQPYPSFDSLQVPVRISTKKDPSTQNVFLTESDGVGHQGATVVIAGDVTVPSPLNSINIGTWTPNSSKSNIFENHSDWNISVLETDIPSVPENNPYLSHVVVVSGERTTNIPNHPRNIFDQVSLLSDPVTGAERQPFAKVYEEPWIFQTGNIPGQGFYAKGATKLVASGRGLWNQAEYAGLPRAKLTVQALPGKDRGPFVNRWIEVEDYNTFQQVMEYRYTPVPTYTDSYGNYRKLISPTSWTFEELVGGGGLPDPVWKDIPFAYRQPNVRTYMVQSTLSMGYVVYSKYSGYHKPTEEAISGARTQISGLMYEQFSSVPSDPTSFDNYVSNLGLSSGAGGRVTGIISYSAYTAGAGPKDHGSHAVYSTVTQVAKFNDVNDLDISFDAMQDSCFEHPIDQNIRMSYYVDFSISDGVSTTTPAPGFTGLNPWQSGTYPDTGSPDTPTTTTTTIAPTTTPDPVCLNRNFEALPTTVQVISGLYVFGNVTTWPGSRLDLFSSSGQSPFGVNTGVYTFINIPSDHPIAFHNSGQTGNFSYTGLGYVASKTGLDGGYYDFYTGTLTGSVSGDFGTISYESYNSGYLGGSGNFFFNSGCI